MERTVLVIGGTRNLGPDLVAALLARGDQVTVLNRGITPDDLPRDVQRLRANRSDEAALRAALGDRSFDLVVDTTLYNGEDAEAIADVLQNRAGRYLFWSTGQVYLVRTGIKPPFAETAYTGPLMGEPPAGNRVDHENWVYGMEKRAAEDALRVACDARRFPYVALRMPMINSRRDHYGRLLSYVRRLKAGEAVLLPDDQDRLRLRHVFGDDVITATLRAGEADAPSGICLNVSQDETLTIEEMLGMVADTLGVTLRTARRPRAELEGSGHLPAGSPWSGRWMSVLANDRGKEILGLRYTPVGDYLPRLVAHAVSGGA